jgi:hypothetical protein
MPARSSPVVAALAKTYRSSNILICADDDYADRRQPRRRGRPPGRRRPRRRNTSSPAFRGRTQSTTKKGPHRFQRPARLKEGIHVVRESTRPPALARLGLSSSAPARAIALPGGRGNRHSQGQPSSSSLQSVGEATERFALIYGGKGTLFDHQEHLLVPKTDVLDIIPRPRLARVEAARRPPGRPPVRSRLRPGRHRPGDPLQPVGRLADRAEGGRLRPQLLELLRLLMSSESEQNAGDLYTWVLRWLAYPIQHPGAKMRTALIFHGPQGTGKNLFFETIMAIYGEYGRIVGQAAIEEPVQRLGQRASCSSSPTKSSPAKSFTTSRTSSSPSSPANGYASTRRTVAAHDERNHCNVVYLSNETQPLPHRPGRPPPLRHLDPDAKLSGESYHAVRDELNAGGGAGPPPATCSTSTSATSTNTPSRRMTQAKRRPDRRRQPATPSASFRAWLGGDIYFRGKRLPVCPMRLGRPLHRLHPLVPRRRRAQPARSPTSSSREIAKLARLVASGHKDRLRQRCTTTAASRSAGASCIPSADVLDAIRASAGRTADSPQTSRRRHPDAKWLTGCFFAFRRNVLSAHP